MEKEKEGIKDVWLRYDASSDFKYSYKYPRWCVTADTVLFNKTAECTRVLLIKRGGEPYRGMWALPGGFVEIDEDVTAGAIRELEEETGVRIKAAEQLGCYSTPGRDPRGPVLTIAHYALTEKTETKAGDDAAESRWFDIDRLPELAFDHDTIISDAVRRIKEKEIK